CFIFFCHVFPLLLSVEYIKNYVAFFLLVTAEYCLFCFGILLSSRFFDSSPVCIRRIVFLSQVPGNTAEESSYIVNETRQLFRKNGSLTDEKEIRDCVREGQARLDIGKSRAVISLGLFRLSSCSNQMGIQSRE